jgi:hypothetical protein
MHLPVFSLIACALACLGGLNRLFVNCFEREIEEEVFDPAG